MPAERIIGSRSAVVRSALVAGAKTGGKNFLDAFLKDCQDRHVPEKHRKDAVAFVCDLLTIPNVDPEETAASAAESIKIQDPVPEDDDSWMVDDDVSGMEPAEPFKAFVAKKLEEKLAGKLSFDWMTSTFEGQPVCLIMTARLKDNQGRTWNLNGTTKGYAKISDAGEDVLFFENGHAVSDHIEIPSTGKVLTFSETSKSSLRGQKVTVHGVIFLWAAKVIPGQEFRFWFNEAGTGDIKRWRKTMD